MSLFALGTRRREAGASAYCYDIDGLVRIVSAVRLPELTFFQVPAVVDADLVIRVRPPKLPPLHTRARLEERSVRLRYREQVGPFGADFEVRLSSPIEVLAGPLLAISPHVLYTNVVEALLRFLLVGKERMLLHSACLSVEGQGILLSAKTDTGKTSTLLRLLEKGDGVFYSDDMTIIDAAGVARRYPKPLTISAHTVRALNIDRLRRSQRTALAVQSRLHSRSGRSVGKQLARPAVPIMAINAVVQAAVPPPKYMVDELVPCRIGRTTELDRLFIIERGEHADPVPMTHEEIVEELLVNTEDAYGFPPYAQIAPLLMVGESSYEELRRREREILTRAMSRVPGERLRVPDFSWPQLIRERLRQTAVPTGEVLGRDAAYAV